MLQGYYDRLRFRYLHERLLRSGLVQYCGPERMRKTGCFYGRDGNIYIDTSDGVNEDLPIAEYTGRLQRIVADAQGKPFLVLKCSFSPVRSAPLIALARAHGGTVVPFAQWPHTEAWFTDLWSQRQALQNLQIATAKTSDVFLGANLTPYHYPRPNASDPSVSWQDHKFFGLGSPKDTGWFTLNTRQQWYDHFIQSPFTFIHTRKVPYDEYLQLSFASKVILIPPGMGEYSQRFFDHGFLGQCMVLRKTTYDAGCSWKQAVPEIDFSQGDWVAKVQGVIAEYQSWQKKISKYFIQHATPNALVALLETSIQKWQAAASIKLL